jgi:hypothetical protein
MSKQSNPRLATGLVRAVDLAPAVDLPPDRADIHLRFLLLGATAM